MVPATLFSLRVIEAAILAAVVPALLYFRRHRAAAARQILRAEAEGLQYQRRLSALAEFANESVLLLADDGQILDANDRAIEMYGYAREELLRLNIRDLRAPDQRTGIDDDFRRAREAGDIRLETVHVRKDGSVFAVESSARLLQTDGAPLFQDIVRNIDGQKAAEAALRASEERWRTIATAAHDAILTFDHEGRITYWNPAAERIFGYQADEVLGRNLHSLLAPERYAAPQHAAFAEWQRTGKGPAVGRTIELAAIRKDGTLCEVELSLASVLVEDRWQAVGVIRDVSARIQSEQELRRARAAAESARVQLLQTNAQLESAVRTAREMAEQAQAASIAKSEFLANMSHEIRTPMNAIIGMTGLLLDTALDHEQREQAEIVRASADALLGLVNGILDYSKIEAGRLELESVDFDLHAVVEDTTELLAVQADEKGLQLSCLIEPGVPVRLRGDPGRLRQVLINLLGNAVKFTAAGEVSVRVTMAGASDAGVTVRFDVRDTGVGIPVDGLRRLFRSFSQVDASITRRFGGTGLGLAISRRLVQLMGGEISVESVPDVGTTFTFTVAFARQRDARDDRRELPESARGRRILIVDDNATNRLVLSEQLRSFGCRYDSAEDAPTALAKLQAGLETGDPFGVAILDLAMPDVDGEILAAEIRRNSAFDGVRLVLFSSWGRRGGIEQLERMGFSAFLSKPLRRGDLFDCLVAVTSRPAPPGGSEQAVPAPPAVVPARAARALVVDDNAVNQKLAVRLLQKIGIRADAVGSALEALRTLDLVPYDVVLMDVQMPEMDGLRAARAIRDRERATGRHLAVIAMTAHAMTGDRERCLSAGMDDYLSKPIERACLEGAIARVLAAGPAGPAADDGRGAANAGVFDRHELAARTEHDEGLMGEMIAAFLRDVPSWQAEIARALDARDPDALRRVGHTMKGSAATLGARGVCAASARLESAGRDADVALARAAAADLAREMERAVPVLAGATAAGAHP
jgi:PAS domain S-box-containing protein